VSPKLGDVLFSYKTFP